MCQKKSGHVQIFETKIWTCPDFWSAMCTSQAWWALALQTLCCHQATQAPAQYGNDASKGAKATENPMPTATHKRAANAAPSRAGTRARAPRGLASPAANWEEQDTCNHTAAGRRSHKTAMTSLPTEGDKRLGDATRENIALQTRSPQPNKGMHPTPQD